MSNSEMMVSIFCTVYNHEKYIRKCLDGFVMQKTSFKYEVLVHDDASTDSTAKIIKEYEVKYPDIIKAIYQTENQYSKGVRIAREILMPMAKGKYVAICEGDDYWCSVNKLQKQVELMENNPSSVFSVHKVRAVNEKGEKLDKFYPNFEIDNNLIDRDTFLSIVCKNYAFQTSSFLIRANQYTKFANETPTFVDVCPIGDIPMMLYFGYHSDNICYLNEEMSCYRSSSNGSWTERQKNNSEYRVNHYRAMKNMVKEYQKYTENKYPDFYSNLYRRWYNQLWFNRDFKEVLDRCYKPFFKEENKKDRFSVYLRVYFPKIASILFRT